MLMAFLVLVVLFPMTSATGKFTGKGPLTVGRAVKQKQLKELAIPVAPAPRGAVVARDLRAKRSEFRQTHFDRPQAGSVLRGGLSFCETEAITPACKKDYLKRVTAFRQFVAEELTTALTPGEGFLHALLEFVDELFFRGHPVEDGRKLIAAIKHHFPVYGRGGPLTLVRAERAIRGWSRHSVTRVRSPMPLQVLMAIVGFLLHHQWGVPAIALLLTFCAYLRPGECFSLLRSHLSPPFPRDGIYFWSVCFRLQEDGVPTKTGVFDESLVLDGVLGAVLNELLPSLYRSRGDSESLWKGYSWEDMLGVLRLACSRLHLEPLGLEWYCLRHGGASHDAAHQLRSAEAVQKRLRHASVTSVRRYEKAGRLAAELRKVPSDVLQFGRDVMPLLPQVFQQRRLLPALPRCESS